MAEGLIQFMRLNTKPTKLNLLLDCWKDNETNLLMKKLSKDGILTGTIQLGNETLTATMKELEMFVLDFECHPNIFQHINLELLNFPHRWFIFIDTIPSLPPQLPIFLNSRIYLFPKEPPHTIRSPYRVLNTTNYVLNKIATFNQSTSTYDGPFVVLSDDKYRSDQMGLIINATGVMINKRSIHHLTDWRYLAEDSISKNNYNLVICLMSILNAEANITYVGSWGTVQPNTNQYTGMIGDIQNGVAQITATAGFMTKDRVLFGDFVTNPIRTFAKFILRAPPLSVVNNILTMPLEPNVWVAMGLLSVLIFFIMLGTTWWEWGAMAYPETIEAQMLRPSAFDVIQLEIGAVCQQGAEAEPRSLSGRIITFITFLSFMFFYTAYSACIVALLQSRSNSITTLEHLLNTNIKLAADNMPYTKYFLSIQKGAIKEAIYKQKMKPENYVHYTDGVELMRNQFVAFHSEADQVYKEISRTYQEHEKCGLIEIKFLSEIEPYMFIKKHLVFRKLIIMGFSKLKEAGIMKRIIKLTYAEKPKCQGSGGEFRSVSLTDAYFAVLCYAIGVTIAMFIYLIERIVKFKANVNI